MVVFSVVSHIHIGPVEIQHIDIFQLHELEHLLYFPLDALAPQVPNLSRDKKLLSLNTSLRDDCLYGSAQSDLIIVHSSGIDVPACAELQSLPEKLCDELDVLQFVSTEALHLQLLFVR